MINFYCTCHNILHLYLYPLIFVNILGSQKCALLLNVPKLIWFKIDLMMTLGRNMSSYLQFDNKLVVF
jgi:hypothetical protein